MRLLAWPGMPDPSAVAEAAARVGAEAEIVAVAANDVIPEHLDDGGPWDLIFPSDHLVERLRGEGRLLALDPQALPLERLAPWARELPYDPRCEHSVPFAFGTTGILHDAALGEVDSWSALLDPPEGVRVGMLAEVREVVGAALLAAGHSPNDASPRALADARALLERQRPRVARWDSDDFTGPVLRGEVGAHHAWSGPAAQAVRWRPEMRYVVPREGAILWVTAAAIPAGAPDPERSLALVRELMDPALAARTTERHGYSTPNDAARDLLPAALREDPALFPPESVRARCEIVRDLGAGELRMARVYAAVAAAPV
jgi:spermidine/putrescine-binding protein